MRPLLQSSAIIGTVLYAVFALVAISAHQFTAAALLYWPIAILVIYVLRLFNRMRRQAFEAGLRGTSHRKDPLEP